MNRAIAFLEGKDNHILSNLRSQMEQAAEQLDFEKAQVLLETIRRIEHVTKDKPSVVKRRLQDRDVFGLYRENHRSLIAKLLFRKGRLIGAESYPLDQIANDEEEIWETFLLQHYASQLILPAEVLLPIPIKSARLLEEILCEQCDKQVRLLATQKGQEAEELALAAKNAKTFFSQDWAARTSREDLLLKLQEVCHLTNYPLHIECFDSSNLSKSDPVACMVGFSKGRRDTKNTRLFHVKQAEGGDDYGALREALLRHYTKAKQLDALPDLLLIDGGKGQLSVAYSVLEKLEIASVDLLALTKEEGKHDKGLRKERIFAPHWKDPLLLEERSPLLFFLQQIRDEAHRVVLAFQRKTRQARTLRSGFTEIPGIGPKKREDSLRILEAPKKRRRPQEKSSSVKQSSQIGISTISTSAFAHKIAAHSVS